MGRRQNRVMIKSYATYIGNKYLCTNMSPSEKSCERVLDPYHISFVFLLSLSLTRSLNFFIMIGGIFMDSSRKIVCTRPGLQVYELQSAYDRGDEDQERWSEKKTFNFRVAWLCVIDRRSKINEWAACKFCQLLVRGISLFARHMIIQVASVQSSKNCRSSDF